LTALAAADHSVIAVVVREMLLWLQKQMLMPWMPTSFGEFGSGFG